MLILYSPIGCQITKLIFSLRKPAVGTHWKHLRGDASNEHHSLFLGRNRQSFLLSLLTHQEREGVQGVQWLIGRGLDSRPRCSGFEPHWRHCIVSLSKTHLSLLSTGSTQEDLSSHS